MINNIENTGTNTNKSEILNSYKPLINKETENLNNISSGTHSKTQNNNIINSNNNNVQKMHSSNLSDSYGNNILNDETIKQHKKVEQDILDNAFLNIKDKNILNNINKYIQENSKYLSSDDKEVIKKSAVFADEIQSDINDTSDILDIVQSSSNALKLDELINNNMPMQQLRNNLGKFYSDSNTDVRLPVNNTFPNVIDYKNLYTGKNTSKTSKELTKPVETGIMNKVKSYITNAVSYKSRLNNHYDYLKNREQMFKDINNGYNDIIDIFNSLNELSVPVRKSLHEYLVGDNLNVSKEIKNLGDKFRNEINKMGMEAVENGLLSRAAFDEWKNVYLYRTYDKTLKQSLKNVFSGIKNKSVLKDKTIAKELKRLNPYGIYKELVRKGESIDTARTISSRIKELLASRGEIYQGTLDDYNILKQNNMLGRLSEGKIAAYKNSDGSYTFRRDYTKSERQAMGEITDGALTIARTMQKLNDMINVGKFLKYIKNDISDKIDSKDLVELKGSQFGALNGHKIPKDIANDLESISNSLFGYNNNLLNLYQKYLRVWKKSVSIYNIATHVSNVISNINLMLMGGFPAYKSIPFILKESSVLNGYSKYKKLLGRYNAGTITDYELKELDKLHNNKNIQTAIFADRNGLFGSNRFNEVLHGGQNPSNNLVKGQGSILKRTSRKVLNKFENAFQMEDNAAKLAMFDYLVNKRNMPVDEALKEIQKIVPDYNAPMHKGIRALRDTGAVPFISWTYYTLPTILKQLNPLGKNNVGKGLNKYNAFNMLKIIGTLSLADYILTSDTSIYDEQPPIFNNKRMPVFEDYNGNVTTLKIDKWLPHLSIFDPVEFFLSQAGAGIPQKLVSNILLDSDPYFRNQITFNKGLHGALDRAEYYTENYIPVPRFLYTTADIAKVNLFDEDKRRKSPFLNPRTPLESTLTGLGFNTLSYNKNRYNKYLENKYR